MVREGESFFFPDLTSVEGVSRPHFPAPLPPPRRPEYASLPASLSSASHPPALPEALPSDRAKAAPLGVVGGGVPPPLRLAYPALVLGLSRHRRSRRPPGAGDLVYDNMIVWVSDPPPPRA